MDTKIKINGDKTIKHNYIKAKLGLTSKKNHSVFYIEGGTFVTPTVDLEDFTEVMNTVESMCKRSLKKKLFNNSFLEPNFLMNFEICSERMNLNKNSYLSFQYHFKQKNNSNLSIMKIKQENESFFSELLNDLENNLKQYKMTLSQKRHNSK
jgi:hypothetical protein